jgi:hypothetical protein
MGRGQSNLVSFVILSTEQPPLKHAATLRFGVSYR